MKNEIKVAFLAIPENESFARMVAAGFVATIDPTLEELNDVKTAISEAVTNAIIHGYEGVEGMVVLQGEINDKEVVFSIEDAGKGIENVEKAMEPMYTTKPEQERSGMGFAFMEAFMDELTVTSRVGEGTRIVMKKKIGQPSFEEDLEGEVYGS